MDWVKEYGHAWEAHLREAWADPKCNIAEATSRLGVTRKVIRKQASRCGLVIAKPGQRLPQACENWQAVAWQANSADAGGDRRKPEQMDYLCY